MYNLYNLSVIALLLTGISSALAQDTSATQGWKFSASGYFQVLMNNTAQSFMLPFAKATIHGTYSKKLSFHIELRPTVGNPLVKAYMGYSLNKLITIMLGQIPNPMKWIEPEPEEKQFAYYALYETYVSNGDDIGLALYGKTSQLIYYACLLNGTGRNLLDNNKSKDVVGYISYAFWPELKVEAAAQTGKQPNDVTRTSGFARFTLYPWPQLQLAFATIGRNDLKAGGWYSTTNYTIGDWSLLGRIHKTIPGNNPEFTLGCQVGTIPVKLQLNTMIGKTRHPEIVLVAQIYIQ